VLCLEYIAIAVIKCDLPCDIYTAGGHRLYSLRSFVCVEAEKRLGFWTIELVSMLFSQLMMLVSALMNRSEVLAVTRSLYDGIRSNSTQELYAKPILTSLPCYKHKLGDLPLCLIYVTYSNMRELHVVMSTLIKVVI
jgi:hypothetical protein